MILLKKWAKHKVKSYIYCVNQFLREKRHKKWNQECKQKQSLLFNFCNIFDLLTSRTQKIAWWPPVFKPDFYIFSFNEQLRKILKSFIDKFLLYHTSLRMCSFQGIILIWTRTYGKVFKSALVYLWNCNLALIFSCKFPAYFHNTFFKNTCGGLLLKEARKR